jgi:hypothetical protein
VARSCSMCGVTTIALILTQSGNLGVFILAGIGVAAASAAVLRLIGQLSGSNPGYEYVDQTSVSPVVRTAEYYEDAWRDRRRRMVIFKAVQISFFPMLLVCWYLSSIRPEWRRLPIAFPAWFIGYMAAGVWLNRFRCPRCGKFYYWRVQLKGSMERQKRWRECHWCGLQQDQCPIA